MLTIINGNNFQNQLYLIVSGSYNNSTIKWNKKILDIP